MEKYTEEYLNLFMDSHNKVEAALKDKLKRNSGGFSENLNLCISRKLLPRAYKDTLHDYGRLRNIIVHEGNRDEPIACPSKKIAQDYSRIAQQICTPLVSVSGLGSRPEILPMDISLAQALEHLQKRGFSQFVVSDGKRYEVVSRNDMFSWFAKQVTEDCALIDLKAFKVTDLIKSSVDPRIPLLPKTVTASDVLGVLSGHGSKVPHAVLVTEHGKSHEQPLRIVTPWDLIAAGILDNE